MIPFDKGSLLPTNIEGKKCYMLNTEVKIYNKKNVRETFDGKFRENHKKITTHHQSLRAIITLFIQPYVICQSLCTPRLLV